MTLDDVRQLALAMPEVEERPHHGHPSFRVGGRIFSTLWPEDGVAVLKLLPEDQADLMAAHPNTFTPAGGWGKHGWTKVDLATVDDELFELLLWGCWRQSAPVSAIRQVDAGGS